MIACLITYDAMITFGVPLQLMVTAPKPSSQNDATIRATYLTASNYPFILKIQI